MYRAPTEPSSYYELIVMLGKYSYNHRHIIVSLLHFHLWLYTLIYKLEWDEPFCWDVCYVQTWFPHHDNIAVEYIL